METAARMQIATALCVSRQLVFCLLAHPPRQVKRVLRRHLVPPCVCPSHCRGWCWNYVSITRTLFAVIEALCVHPGTRLTLQRQLPPGSSLLRALLAGACACLCAVLRQSPDLMLQALVPLRRGQTAASRVHRLRALWRQAVLLRARHLPAARVLQTGTCRQWTPLPNTLMLPYSESAQRALCAAAPGVTLAALQQFVLRCVWGRTPEAMYSHTPRANPGTVLLYLASGAWDAGLEVQLLGDVAWRTLERAPAAWRALWQWFWKIWCGVPLEEAVAATPMLLRALALRSEGLAYRLASSDAPPELPPVRGPAWYCPRRGTLTARRCLIDLPTPELHSALSELLHDPSWRTQLHRAGLTPVRQSRYRETTGGLEERLRARKRTRAHLLALPQEAQTLYRVCAAADIQIRRQKRRRHNQVRTQTGARRHVRPAALRKEDLFPNAIVTALAQAGSLV